MDIFDQESIIRELVKSEGWMLFKDKANMEIDRCRDQLEQCVREDVEKIQGRVQGIRFCLGVPVSIIQLAKLKEKGGE